MHIACYNLHRLGAVSLSLSRDGAVFTLAKADLSLPDDTSRFAADLVALIPQVLIYVEGYDAPPFTKEVWKALSEIPFGETCSYGQLARAVGKPGAARAVGQALHINPFAPILPCHRILRSDGSLGGYAGGLPLKTKLLAWERWAAKTVNNFPRK